MSSQYDFDTIIDRHHTGAMKTDVLCERYGREDLIPLWIADMDFAVAPCITEARTPVTTPGLRICRGSCELLAIHYRLARLPAWLESKKRMDHLYSRDCQGHRFGSQCI